ncbi:hypothetical protein CGRA01v4_13003 [Colletotrichum graminicola]|uniref:Uncharacterized protein n=1 Tax=Colletotrichum graminicola (strain M1.001 / M2 / FGSC 10212) TaxID=645133 RepID=E3QLV5_COLGM|nr:uncharacterized protein GLRG_06987 [Colletotrichum graminicola M1.001]EFQ31843.1 hypothetical protein GLRG_06987 [Colletotrichum graminicola M1.001]WDK21713.1 hypothetical protein CGRA01v4_13003 [Colletotrichum graminicola]
MAPTASERAQAKFFAVIEDPRRYDSSNFKNRVMITRTPSGGSELTNIVSRPPPRRGSSSSQGSVVEQQTIRSRIKTWMYPRAV